MLIVHVFIHVKPECIKDFEIATIENARNSMEEPGVAGFDMFQQEDDQERFLLVESYKTSDDPARHKATAHYALWRDTVEPMMAEPRKSIKYIDIFPSSKTRKGTDKSSK